MAGPLRLRDAATLPGAVSIVYREDPRPDSAQRHRLRHFGRLLFPSKANSIADGDERMARIDARRSAAGVLK